MSWFPRSGMTVPLLGALMVAPCTSAAADQDASLPVSTAVKSLTVTGSEVSRPADPAEMARPEPPPATLPDDRLPQYQMGYQRRELLSESEKENGEIRFVLAAPAAVDVIGRPLLIRVVVRIDGEPFTVVRDQRAEALVTSLALPSEQAGEETESSNLKDGDADSSESDAEAEVGGEAEGIAAQPAMVPAYQLTTEPSELLRRYREAVGEPVSKDETDWMLTHWTDGPQLLLLHPYFQSFRADQRPAYQVLDRDRDGTVSQQELAGAVESFQKCDTNRDDIVDVLEIAKAAESSRDLSATTVVDSPLLLMLAALQQITQDDPALFGVFQQLDSDQDGRIDASEVVALRKRSPDLDLLVQFDTKDSKRSELTLISISEDLRPRIDVLSSVNGVDIKIGDTTFNFAAVQGRAADQISLGAVIDGYPLLPSLDPNDDGRFTLRELRQLDSRLRRFDVNEDGQLTSQETTSPIRICVGLGATVHRELAGVRSINMADQPEIMRGPDWFVRMDRNTDNDLTRAEFPGTDQQFESLDANGDQLVSPVEAIEFDSQSPRSQPE